MHPHQGVPATLTARQRARAEVTSEILREARRQLASEGAPSISLRAIARELGMPPSAIHRYFATRDDLLTTLIVEAYDSIGTAAEESQAGLPADDVAGRFAAACRSLRGWALERPHEYSLVFGSPIPDYEAPEATTPAAARVPAVLGALLREASRRTRKSRRPHLAMSESATRAIAPALEFFAHELPPERVQAALMVWMGIFGTISFELYGHQHGSVGSSPADRGAFFDSCISAWSEQLGLA